MSTVIVFSHLRWSFVWQRPQHLMSQLAEHHRVVFVEEPVHDTTAPAHLACQPQGPNLQVLVPHTPVDAHGFHDDQLPVLRPLIEAWLRDNAVDDHLVWFYTPMALPLMTPLRPRMVVYDCMDELSAFKDAPRQLRQRETALMKTADLVLTGGPSLYQAKRTLHPNVHCLPSAVDAAHFAPPRDDDAPQAQQAAALQAHLPQPRLGFFGVIDERLDLGLIGHLAAERPDWQFVMAGPVAKIDPAALPRRGNLHWLGMQPYERLPHLMAGWDVCVMPFALNEATRHISPTKTLEYLAGEKPVVSTAVPDVVSLYGDLVAVARTPDEFVQACESALRETTWQRARRLARTTPTVFRSSWTQRAQFIRRLIDEHLAQSPARPAAPAALREPAAPALGGTALTAAPRRAARQVRQLVIGAGPTGLATALNLGADAPRGDTLVVEREAQVGGWCRSVQQQGYTFDCAGHIMFSTDPYVLDLYEKLLGDNLHWQNREAWVWSKNVYTRYPFQGSLYGLPPKVLKECILGAIEARFGPLDGSAPPPAAPPANFEQFIDRVWGKGIAEHFAVPYNRKLWAVPLAEMETSWLGGRVPLPDLAQMIEGALEPSPRPMGPNARFGYPLRGGFQALMEGFLPLLNCELELDTGVLQVSPSRRSVRLDDGRWVGYETLVSTMPLPRLVEACGDEAPAEVQAAAAGLRQVAVRCVNLGVALAPGQERLTDKHWVYYPEDTVFHRIFVQGNASPHNNPPGGFGLTCEITYAPGKPLPCEGAALVDRCIADCRKVGMIGPQNAVHVANQVDMPCAYVVYDHARSQNVATIREWLAGFDIVLAGRYAEWEYYNSDHAFLAGRKAAQTVRRMRDERAVAAAG
jgi:protoporphyrinogen oxidase/glycosyltransferase involved in cell wall biosynthesis